ncbi:MAG: histidinol-phosphatase HisJ family protein [Planctomycetes bacterium]|jgi:histidinol-phosphatase (PHP family)|nr:histidinol-phosphatase HisJ family protein [Planctomycetota bacterium]
MPQADYHIHTAWCGHADGTMEEYVEQAIALGLPEMGFSPHLPLEIPIEEKVCLTLEEMDAFLEEFHRLRKAYAAVIPLRLGGEADFAPGTENEIERLKERYGLEYLIGSIHILGDWAFDHPKYIDGFAARPIDRIYSDYFGLVADAAKTGLFDLIGHLDLPKKFGHRPTNGCLPYAERALAAMAAGGVAVEINTAGRDKPVGEFYPSRDILEACQRAGVKLTFGSDSHAPGQVGRYFDEAADLARSAGYTRTLRLNPEREAVDLSGS